MISTVEQIISRIVGPKICVNFSHVFLKSFFYDQNNSQSVFIEQNANKFSGPALLLVVVQTHDHVIPGHTYYN